MWSHTFFFVDQERASAPDTRHLCPLLRLQKHSTGFVTSRHRGTNSYNGSPRREIEIRYGERRAMILKNETKCTAHTLSRSILLRSVIIISGGRPCTAPATFFASVRACLSFSRKQRKKVAEIRLRCRRRRLMLTNLCGGRPRGLQQQ